MYETKHLQAFFISIIAVSLAACATPSHNASSPTANPFENSEKKSPEELAQMYVELGTSALLRGEFAQAIEDLNKGLKHHSDNAVAHNHLGLAYYGLQKREMARTEMERAAAIDPKYSDAWVNLGTLAVEEGDRTLARKYFSKALDNLEYKHRHRALTNLAQVELTENKTDAARKLLYQSLQSNPDYCLSHFLLGNIFARENNHKRAADEFKLSVAKTCASNPEGHFQLGLAYLKVKQYDRARQEFVYLIQEHPETAQANKAGEQLKNIP